MESYDLQLEAQDIDNEDDWKITELKYKIMRGDKQQDEENNWYSNRSRFGSCTCN